MTRVTDTTDRRLLALLQANARESTTTLARKLGVARTTVQERISRLQRSGTIRGYSVVLRRDPAEQYAEALVLIDVKHRMQKAVVEKLRELPEIKLCQTTTGDFEIICRLKVSQMEDIAPTLDAISEITGVDQLKSMVILSTSFERGQADGAMLAAFQAAAIHQGEAG